MRTGPSYYSNCVSGVGSQAAKENLHRFDRVEAACLLAPKKKQSPCFQAALTYTFFADGRKKMPPSVCAQTKKFKSACLSWKHG